MPGATRPLSLDPAALPGYTLQTVTRMGMAMAASLVFTSIYGSLAAKSERAGRILIPLLDILQSVSILGFLSITVIGFLKLFPGNMLGPELAAVFAIFTSQAWNMTFSFYASLRMVPRDLHQASAVFGLSTWQRFWKNEVPFAAPNPVWNAMMPVAGGWFFVVAAEAISVDSYTINLPGIGSYIALAIGRKDAGAMAYAVSAMLRVILATDPLLFRPLVAWAERFKVELAPGAHAPRSWLLNALRRSRTARLAVDVVLRLWELSYRLPVGRRSRPPGRRRLRLGARAGRVLDRWWTLVLVAVAGMSIVALARFVHDEVSYGEIGQVAAYSLITVLRVVVLTLLATLIWVPIGVWIGLRPRLAQRAQPAVFPAYVTGGLTASGGAWNASVVAEVASWGADTLSATGIGAYIAANTTAGDHPRIALGVAVMSLYVIALNRTVWEKLYVLARRRFALE